MKKRGQTELSFGMIFSIILIIAFITVAFFGIKKFLDFRNSTQIAQFGAEFQEDINKMWRAEGSEEKSYILPSKIEALCFMDADKNSAGKNREWKEELERNYFEEENIFFYPPESGKGMNSKKIEHLNLNEITKTENPFCIEIADGRAKMIIQKNYGELSVRVLRE